MGGRRTARPDAFGFLGIAAVFALVAAHALPADNVIANVYQVELIGHGHVALQFLGAELTLAAGETSFPQSEVKKRIAGRVKRCKRTTLGLVRPADTATGFLVAASTLIAGNEHALIGDLLAEIRLEPDYLDFQRQLQVIQVLVHGLVLVTGVAEDRHQVLAANPIDGQLQGGSGILAARHADDVLNFHATPKMNQAAQ